MAVDAEGAQAHAGVLYGRFTRRLRAVAIDFTLFLAAMVAALQIAITLNNSDLARIVGFGFMAGFFLYEPLMVSIAGGTSGHYLSNLRVVDDRTRGNVSFLKAVARVVIKTVLSWYSFVSMAAARRHQAVHDLLTRSTVQVRDPTKALPSHYSRERVELSAPGMPSRTRRIVVIVAYVLASYMVLGVVMQGLIIAGFLRRACLHYDRYSVCSYGDHVLMAVLGLAWIVLVVLCVGRGWRGRLWGARVRA
jgi:hypothetical protein